MGNFFEQHAALLILSMFLLLGLSATFLLGWHAHIDPEKLFAFFGGFSMGVFSALTLAMRGAAPASTNGGNGGPK
jgi:uncharacterized membrane protein YoaK (UPF0700 family)